jgi:hypothetical protein
MSESGSNILDRGLTPDQMRANIAAKDRVSWFPGRHASGEFGLIAGRDGREVARCARETDRDSIIHLAKSHDVLVFALEALTDAADARVNLEDHLDAARKALDFAHGSIAPRQMDDEIIGAGAHRI